MAESVRYKYLDYGKGLGILSVLLYHVSQFFPDWYYMNSFLRSYNISIFFIVSGCLAYHKRDKIVPFQQYVRVRARVLMLPYLYFSVIKIIMRIGMNALRGTLTKAVFADELVDFFIIGNGSVWFLSTLFVVELAFWWIKHWTKDNRIILVLSLICLLAHGLLNHLAVWPQGAFINRTVLAIGFYLLGYLFPPIQEKIWKKGVTKYKVILYAALIAGLACSANVDSGSIWMNGIFHSWPLWSIAGAFISLSFVGALIYDERIGRKNITTKILDYYGTNSLAVMLIHPFVLDVFIYGFMNTALSLGGAYNVIIPIVVFILLSLAQIPAVWIMNHYFPWLMGKRKKI